MDYETPQVKDLGQLAELTAACVGSGALDDANKTDNDPFKDASPAFGDPSFCNP